MSGLPYFGSHVGDWFVSIVDLSIHCCKFGDSAFWPQKVAEKCVNLDGIILRQKCVNHPDPKNFV